MAASLAITRSVSIDPGGRARRPARALSLPEGAPLAIFALGRAVGWIGHVIEQYHDDRLVRSRARYVGRQP